MTPDGESEQKSKFDGTLQRVINYRSAVCSKTRAHMGIQSSLSATLDRSSSLIYSYFPFYPCVDGFVASPFQLQFTRANLQVKDPNLSSSTQNTANMHSYGSKHKSVRYHVICSLIVM